MSRHDVLDRSSERDLQALALVDSSAVLLEEADEGEAATDEAADVGYEVEVLLDTALVGRSEEKAREGTSERKARTRSARRARRTATRDESETNHLEELQ
jgi:hypothetical protein